MQLLNFLLNYSGASIGVLDKIMFWFLEAPVQDLFRKFWRIPVKHPWVIFKYTSEPFKELFIAAIM